MKPKPAPRIPRPSEWLPGAFAVTFGGFLALSLLKFGNPPILESYVTAPQDPYEFVFFSPWPITWAYGMFSALAVLGAFVTRKRSGLPLWLILLPIAWLVWQFVAGNSPLDARFTGAILLHFAVCVCCFYLGLLSLSRTEDLGMFWLPVFAAFFLVLAVGWEQHFGGLDETRKYFFLYLYPKMPHVSPEYLKKMSSGRIFSTLFYPNTLAGALLLFLPPLLAFTFQSSRLTFAARVFIAAVLALGAMGCLYWSGSKAGWLLMLVLGVLALLRTTLTNKYKVTLISGVLLLGVAGFFWKHASFFEKGATSVGARFDYWEAALRITKAHPLTGVGPGGFGSAYQAIKRPESELTKLVHNDYLEQGSDSGLPGMTLYVVFIVAALIWTRPRGGWTRGRGFATKTAASRFVPVPTGNPEPEGSLRGEAGDEEYFAVWLGVLGWGLQSLVEFALYIPPLSWTAFGLLGWLVAVSAGRKTLDKRG